ncbi:MAG: response regulator [Verrucomicrobiota bacterium]
MDSNPIPFPSNSARASGTILVVDDEESVRIITSRMLEFFGYSVLLAKNGKQGIQVFKTKKDTISAIILDMTLPDISGEDVFREFQLIRNDARVLLISGYNEADAMERFAGKGLAGFLQKPFAPPELREKLRTILET